MKPTIFILNFLLIPLCLISLFGGLVYRFYSLNKLGLVISLILAVISFVIIQYFYLISNKKTRHAEKKFVDKNPASAPLIIRCLGAGGYCLLIAACFYILLSRQTTNSLISPWQVVPKYFFIIYGLATLVLIGNIIINKKIALPLIIFHYFLSFSVALIIYQLGYGYDSFIHQATENLLDKTGLVEPKPFYYLGQYGLIVILHKITTIPLVWIDKLLVPLLAALFLPITLWRVLQVWFNNSERLNLILILALLTLTYPFLIVTTPQNLAYFLLILVILLGLVCKNFYDFLIILLLSSTAAITQPLAGLPALLFSALLAVYHSDKIKIKKYLYSLLIIITVFILPALFYVLDKKISPPDQSDILSQDFNLFKLSLPGQENFILNFVYLFGFNYKFILILLVASGIFIAWKFKEQCQILFLYLALALSLFVSYLITVKIPFAFLIDYERSDYPERILLTAALFLWPFIILAIYALLEKILLQNTFIKLSFAVLLTLLISAALYLTYPRYDNYFNSHGYSVSAADIRAVNWINENADNDFIVLANQQTSAAALNQFGFKKYYPTADAKNSWLFYYSIPTGSPLYRYYLDMVYKKPSRETMLKAMALAKVKQGYFVLNKYWWAFPKILAEAKLAADSWREINQGEIYVFKYTKN